MKVKVITNAKKFSLTTREGKIIAHVKAQPQKGKANKELIKKLSKIIGKKALITKGATNKEKEIEFNGISDEQAKQKLRSTAGVAEPGQKKNHFQFNEKKPPSTFGQFSGKDTRRFQEKKKLF